MHDLTACDGIILSDRDRSIIKRVLAPFADRIERVGVFGSRALGTAKPASDIDLVLWGEVQPATRARIWSEFDRSALAVAVDVVAYGPDLYAPFRRHIDTVAKPLFSRAQLIER